MAQRNFNLLLADDDQDDCLFFKAALEELQFPSNLITVRDGVELMRYLATGAVLPDVLFLDLNMPRKNGIECLDDIKTNVSYAHIPIVIYSTSFDSDVVRSLFEKGARNYIRKPGDFAKLKQVINTALAAITLENVGLHAQSDFVIHA